MCHEKNVTREIKPESRVVKFEKKPRTNNIIVFTRESFESVFNFYVDFLIAENKDLSPSVAALMVDMIKDILLNRNIAQRR